MGVGLRSFRDRVLALLGRCMARPASDKLCIFRRDPIVLIVSNLQLRWYSITIIFIVILVTPKLILSGIDHTLTSPDLLSNFKHDLITFPPFSAILSLISWTTESVGLGDPFNWISPDKYKDSSAYLPYLRDYTDMFFIIFLSAHLALIFIQWRRISDVLANLYLSGINREIIGSDELSEIVATNNKRFNNPVLQMVGLAGAIGLVLMILAAFSNDGIYSGLSSGNETRAIWEMQAYANSWYRHDILLLFHGATYVFFFYYILMHNIVGVTSLTMLLDLRKKYSQPQGKPLFVIQPNHPDRSVGLGELRQILIYVYISILMMGVTLIFGYSYLPSGTPAYLAPFLAIFFLLNPLFVVIPLIVIRRELEDDKRRKLKILYTRVSEYRSRLLADPTTGIGNPAVDATQYQLTLHEYESFQKCPTSLFSIGRSLVFFVAYFASLIQVVAALDVIGS